MEESVGEEAPQHAYIPGEAYIQKLRLRGGGDAFGTPPGPPSPTYSPTPGSPEAEYPAAFVQDYPTLLVSDLEAAGFTVLDGRVVPPEPPPASPIHDAPPAAQPSLPGSSQAGPSTLPFGKPTHECQEEMFGVHFSDAVASRVFITLLEMGHEVDEERVHTFVCGQLCAEPKPLKGIIFYVNKYVGEVVDGALEGLDGVVVYGRDHDSDSR